MRKERITRRGERASGVEENYLPVLDLIGYLSRAARLHDDISTGNLKLSSGLRLLANALRPYTNRSIRELGELLAEGKSLDREETSSKKITATLLANISEISHSDIQNILEDENYSKSQLVELAVARFTIPPSQLSRLNRSSVLESIRIAVDHERSLDVISQEARRGGANRSSRGEEKSSHANNGVPIP